MQNRALLGLVAAGLAGGVASVAAAQPFLINISGATAQATFLTAPASTNDFIDADGDGNTTMNNPAASQLAPTINFAASDPLGASNLYWVVDYRQVGSGNGLADLVAFGTQFAIYGDGTTMEGTSFDETTLDSGDVDDALLNRVVYIDSTVPIGDANINNPGALPVRGLFANDEATLEDFSLDVRGIAPLTPGDDVSGVNAGTRIDIAPLDVPVSWFVTVDGAGEPEANPATSGYGNNPRLAVNKDGTETMQGNTLKSLGDLNTNLANPDANTVYSTVVANVPIGAMVNHGVGYEQITQSSLRSLMATGRLITGENLMCVTRDSGSGTRNSFASTIGLDPSWCVGENIGPKNAEAATRLAGPDYLPSNKGGSSEVRFTVINSRLAIGHNSAARGDSRGWLNDGRAELLAVQFDLKGGTEFSRPFIDDLLDNDANGYSITAPATFATVGDPQAATTGNPAMRNAAASDYMVNIIESVQAFEDADGDAAFFSPGEFLGLFELSNSAVDFIPPEDDPNALIPNPGFNQALQDTVRANSNFGGSNYEFFNSVPGVVPQRTDLSGSGATYSDGVSSENYYLTQNMEQLSYNGPSVLERNALAGDFNNDGARDWNDAVELVAAWEDRNGPGAPTFAWQAGTDACIELLGDFNNDGSFTTQDVRYWADGLALDPMTLELDRNEGFTRVDNASAARGATVNFFGTSIATGKAYEAGDSRGDVAGNLPTRGFDPVGWDGVIDGQDIDYVYANFGDWSDIQQSVFIDLSADMNGDLIIDQDDVCDLVLNILGTEFGDVNLDGVVDSTDRSIATANLNMPGGWADGDMNGDGFVDQADLDVIDGLTNPCAASCPQDLDGSGTVGSADLAALISQWGQLGTSADFNGDGVGADDLATLISAWGPCPQ
jgi:hypothetical protein